MATVRDSADPLVLLRHEHKSLSGLFARHQEALLARGWARAARLLSHYQQRLAAQIHVEDEILLPYAMSSGTSSLCRDAHVYRTEHYKLLELTEHVSERFAVARRRGVTSTMLINLLDQELTLKRAFEQHHKREEKGLFRELPGCLPIETRMKLRSVLPALH